MEAADEISISELLRDIRTQWKVVIGTAVLFGLVALLYVYIKPDLYRYTMNIEIGQSPRDFLSEKANFIMVPPAQIQPHGFERPHIVMAQFEDGWLPEAVEEVISSGEGNWQAGDAPPFDLSNPEDREHRDTLLVKVSTLAPLQHDEMVTAVLRKAGLRLVAEHAEFLEQIMKRKERNLARLYRERDRMDVRLTDHDQRIRELQRLVDSGNPGGLAAAVELNTAIPERRDLAENRVEIMGAIDGIEDELGVLRSAVEEFQVDSLDDETLRRQKNAAAAVKATLSVRPTRILHQPRRTSNPVGVDPRLIVLLAAVVGLGIGLILALVVQAVLRERGLPGG